MSNQSTTARQNDNSPRTERPESNHTETPPENEKVAEPAKPDFESVADDENTAELSPDLVFDALKNSRRRHVLRYLKERGERVTLSDLAEHVAAIENDTTATALNSDQRKRVYVGLYQCHLPRLDDMDIIEFNQSRSHVELGSAAPQLDKHLYIEEDDDRPWYRYYVGFVAVSALALMTGVVAGVIESTGAAALPVGTNVGVAGLAVFHAYERTS